MDVDTSIATQAVPLTTEEQPSSPTLFRQTFSNQDSLSSFIAGSYGDQETSDITLSTDQSSETYRVHKLVLSQSPVFRSMLYGVGWQESGASSVLLKENDNYVPYLGLFLKYMYGVSINITWENVEALVYFGDKYVVDSLLDRCLQFFTSNVEVNGDLLCAFNAWKISTRVLVLQKDKFESLQSLLFSNIEQIMTQSSIISGMDEDDLKLFLKSDELVCRSEFSVYKLFESWLLTKAEDCRLSLFFRMSALLRLPHMHVQELAYVENSPSRLFPDELSDSHTQCQMHLKLLLCEAYKFHVMDKRSRDAYAGVAHPRHYKEASICMCYRLKNVNALTSWTKMNDYFDCKTSISQADAGLSVSFCVTLMRKINASKLNSTTSSHRSSLLSLEVHQLSSTPLHYTSGTVYVKENRSGSVLLRPLTRFDVQDGVVRTEIKLDNINFDDLLKKSIYQYTDSNNVSVYLALDIFLHT